MALATAHRTQFEASTIRTVDELGLIANAWTQLQGLSTDASVFSTWQWNHAAARHFWRPDALHVTLVEDNGDPVAILPLARRRIAGMKGLAFLGSGPFDYGRADYQDALIENGWEVEACGVFADGLQAAGEWDVLMLQDLPESSRLLRYFPEMAHSHGWTVCQQPDNDVYVIELPATWDEYAATLSTNVRSNLGRKQRKLEREHEGRFERVASPDQLDNALERLFDLHNHRWHEKHGSTEVDTIFSREACREFHREVARNLLWGGMLDLTLLHAEGEVIGARYSFEYHGSKSFYASGYRTDEEWGKFSLGAMMDLQSVQTSIEAGFKYEDLLRNEGEYKSRYAPMRFDNQRVLVFRTRKAERQYRAYQSLKMMAKRLLGRT
jgi:CelD/BcsL family acetyltransferase involved in cellulose biosynthesis